MGSYFPYSILRDNGYSKNNRLKYSYAQEITNRAVLTEIANRNKSNDMAEQYLTEISDEFPDALKLQCVPEDRELWKLENFEVFLENRRVQLALELNKFLNDITETSEDEVDMDLIEMIEAGENSEVEFKTTLRYDVKQKVTNKIRRELF